MTSVTITNALPGEGYENTVLVSENAAVKVHYADENGKPIQGVSLMLSITKKGNGGGSYEVKGAPSAVTDANGNVTFSIGSRSDVSANNTQAVASYDYTIKTVEDGKEVKAGTLRFAALTIDNVTKTSTNKVLSSNITNTNLDNTAVTSGTGTNRETYVYSQQVSTTDENKVTFGGGIPMINLPSENARAVYGEQDVNQSVSEYHTYEGNDSAKIAKLEVDPTQLEYATLRFKNIKISEETRMVITAHKNEADAKSGSNALNIRGSVAGGTEIVIDGKSVKGDQGVQVPLNNTNEHELWFRVSIRSAGQVNTATRSYDWDKIEYMYRTQVSSTAQPYAGATVEWSAVPALMSEERDITGNTRIINALMSVAANNRVELREGKKSGDAVSGKAVARVTYCVPSFPRTGNAVITTYDKNGSVIDYYAYPTINKTNIEGNPIDNYIAAGRNENVLAFYANGTNTWVPCQSNYTCYLISEQEALSSTGEITAQDGRSVTVNATKTGYTLLKGSLMIDGEPIQNKLTAYDDADATVYTYVQWNPVAKKTDDAGFIALKGQNIVITGQLVDKNGNPVASRGEEISFKTSKAAIPAVQGTRVEANGTYGDKKATVVTNERYTDSNGRARLILNSGEIATIEGVCADAISNKQYSVIMTVGTEATPSDKVDLYWIDADIEFTDTVIGTSITQKTDAVNSVVSTNTAGITLKADAGEIWEYGVKVFSNKLQGGIWNGKDVGITGLITDMKKSVSSVGTVTQLQNQNRVYVDSKQNGQIDIVSAIQNKKFDGVKFIVDGKEFPNAGDASTATTINKQLTINVNWNQAGQQISFVNAASVSATGGNYATADRTMAKAPVYIRVTDTYGNNIDGKQVKVKVENGGIDANELADRDKVAVDNTYITTAGAIGTDIVEATGLLTSTEGNTTGTGYQEGLLKLYVNGVAGVNYTTVTATDTATNQSVAYTITWTTPQTFALDTSVLGGTSTYASRYDGADKITLTFTQNLVESSVQAGSFKVYYGVDANNGNEKEYKISNVELINGNQIVLTVPEFNKIGIGRYDAVTVRLGKQTNVGGIMYNLTSLNGDRLGSDYPEENAIIAIKVSQDGVPNQAKELP